MTSLISPITMPQDVQLKIFSNLKPREYLPLMEVSSTWNKAIKEVLKKGLWLDYIPFGKELGTYQDHDCVRSTKELKGRIRMFIKQLVAKKKRGVFICFFPLNDSSDNYSPWLAFKWNPRDLKYSSDPIPMGKNFGLSSIQAILPYIQGQKFSEDTSKLAIKVCFAVRKLANDKVLTPTPFGSTALTYEKLIKDTILNDIPLVFYTGIWPLQEVHGRLLGEVRDIFYDIVTKSYHAEREPSSPILKFLLVSLALSSVAIMALSFFTKKKL